MWKMLRSLMRNVRSLESGKRFAGHSKWANIKHDKGIKDAQRSLLFTKLGRWIKVAIAEGGGSTDPKSNLKLEQVLEQARRANMPNATVQSIIKSAQMNKSLAKSYMLEIKGPGSCLILCEVFTDHLHQTKQSIATILRKNSGKYLDGGAKHQFEQKGVIETELPDDLTGALEAATDDAIECGAEDVRQLDDCLQFFCSAGSLRKVTEQLEAARYRVINSSVEHIPLTEQSLTDEELTAAGRLLDKLEEMQEVVKLSDNIA